MKETDSQIELDGKRILHGDETSIKVVFNNLTGKNFRNPPVWKTLTHEDYLMMMEKEWGVSLHAGRELTLRHAGTRKTHIIDRQTL